MFKKSVVLALILSPIIAALVIGYPVQNGRRSYEIDNLSQYLWQSKTLSRLNGLKLVLQVRKRVCQLLF